MLFWKDSGGLAVCNAVARTGGNVGALSYWVGGKHGSHTAVSGQSGSPVVLFWRNNPLVLGETAQVLPACAWDFFGRCHGFELSDVC